MTRRVVITGMGIVSCLGNNVEEVTASLKTQKSGIQIDPSYQDRGFRSHLAGNISLPESMLPPKKHARFMGDAALYSYIAMQQAIASAELTPEMLSKRTTGLIVGSGGGSNDNIIDANEQLKSSQSTKRVGPYRVSRTMASTVSACLSTLFEIKGTAYSVSSACATSGHCIGTALERIQWGKEDIMFAGGGEECHWSMSMLFDGMGALSTRNDDPKTASRPFDQDRNGFVISGGGILVLEALDHAIARNAPILAEITGYGSCSDGYNLVQPSGEGAVHAMNTALTQHQTLSQHPIDYINAHGTSTMIGDVREIQAIESVMQDNMPIISSTKAISGHSLGATSVHEIIYSLIMMKQGFVFGNCNTENLMPEASHLKPFLIRENQTFNMKAFMSNSFGFGGSNCTLVVSNIT